MGGPLESTEASVKSISLPGITSLSRCLWQNVLIRSCFSCNPLIQHNDESSPLMRRPRRYQSCSDQFFERRSSSSSSWSDDPGGNSIRQADSCPCISMARAAAASEWFPRLLPTALKRLRPCASLSSSSTATTAAAAAAEVKRNCGSPRTGISLFMMHNNASSCSSLSSSSDFFFFSQQGRSGTPTPPLSRCFSPAAFHQPKPHRRCSNLTSVLNDKFPTTKANMERRLNAFIDAESDLLKTPSKLTDPTARFAHKQLLELSKDCLKRAIDQTMATAYFAELQAKLQRLVDECETKIISAEAFRELRSKVTEFLLVISRTAHLVECLDHDAHQMYRTMDYLESSMMAEAAAAAAVSKTDIARYIASQLIDSSVVGRQFGGESAAAVARDNPKLPTLKDFRMIRILSSGAYGSVGLVEHERSGTLMAMKKMSKSMIRLKNVSEQVMNERDILTFASKNPFVVTLYCSLETDLHLYLLMEYVEGGDLSSLLSSFSTYVLPLDLATMYFAETALALEFVHSFGIIHRDLKPSNLLITASGHIKLSDFGLSKVGIMSVAASGDSAFTAGDYDEDVRFDDKQVLGSPQYMAPEIILRKSYGKGVDWWSMGIIFYEMLVGITPFNANTVDDLFTCIICDPIEWPDDFEHHAAKELILGLLRRTPDLRISRVREHVFFANFDWDAVLLKKADYIPKIAEESATNRGNLGEWSGEEEDEAEEEELEDEGSRLDFSYSACSNALTHTFGARCGVS